VLCGFSCHPCVRHLKPSSPARQPLKATGRCDGRNCRTCNATNSGASADLAEGPDLETIDGWELPEAIHSIDSEFTAAHRRKRIPRFTSYWRIEQPGEELPEHFSGWDPLTYPYPCSLNPLGL
jgi:hypothetical protein